MRDRVNGQHAGVMSRALANDRPDDLDLEATAVLSHGVISGNICLSATQWFVYWHGVWESGE